MTTPVRPTSGALSPLDLDDVSIDAGFWAELQSRNAAVSIPHCREWMERVGWVDNLRHAHATTLPANRTGREFADSDVYKLVEAMLWESARTGAGTAEIKELAAVVAAAPEPDGYLNTAFGRPGQPARYSDLEWGHELYCSGHLIQAGVAALRTGGAPGLTDAAIRAADHVCREFGPSGRQGVCGHPEIETALVELFRATGERSYLDQARLFIDRRGFGTLADVAPSRAYFADDEPVRERSVFAGHAVRALYLAAGAVDVAVETGDDQLLAAVAGQWERAVARRTYLTGGMGARHEGESFGDDFELPPDRAYAETCAGVAAVMLSWRLLLATGEARYADLIERVLYNVVAASPALDGHAFFYANPLQVRAPGEPPRPDAPSPRAAGGLRAPWFEVSCCPTNVARTLAALGAYMSTVESGGLRLHQYASGTVTAEVGGEPLALTVATEYPWEGTVRVAVTRAPARPWRLWMRVPAWAGRGRLLAPDGVRQAEPGYVSVRRVWRPGDEVTLELPVRPRWVRADARVDAVRGCVAVERGPLVYCGESVDGPVDSVAVDPSAPFAEEPVPALGPAVVGLVAGGHPVTGRELAWPYAPHVASTAGATRRVRLVPYHLWANRGPTAMRVWFPHGAAARVPDR